MEKANKIGLDAQTFTAPRPRFDIRTRTQETVLMGTPIDRPNGYEPVIQTLMSQRQEDGTSRFWPIFIGSHKAHPAGFPLMEESSYVRGVANEVLPEDEQLRRSLVILAKTMEKGQSADVVNGLAKAQPIFDKLKVDKLGVLRPKDVKGYDEDEKNALLAENRRLQITTLGKVVENGQSIIVLPEGTVQSGRYKEGGKPGEITGLVELQPDSIAYLAQLLKRQGKEPLLFFMGTTGENKIYDPNKGETGGVVTSAKIRAGARAIPPLGRIVPPIMSAVVDFPTPYSDIVDAFGTNGRMERGILEQYCGERLAQLLPLDERGSVYNEPQLLDQAPHILRRQTGYIFGR